MERNIAEAFKAKQNAEEKFRAGDLVGAQKCALKAESLCPSLAGLACLMASIGVHLSAQKRINGEIDWYAVVGVEPTADDETIQSGHRRIVLALLSDQQKPVGSDGAFTLLSEAWNVLCNQTKKQSYDQRCGIQPRQHIGLHEFKGVLSSIGLNNQADSFSSSSVPPKTEDTFWTICKSCSIKYEYLKEYKNTSMLCAHCEKPFEAIEVPPPEMGSSSIWDSGKQRSRKTNIYSRPAKPVASIGQSSIFCPVNLVGPGGRGSVSGQQSMGVRDMFVHLKRNSSAQMSRGAEIPLSQSSSSTRVTLSQLRMVGGGRSNPIQPSSRARNMLHQFQPPTPINLVFFPIRLRKALVEKAKRVIKQSSEEHRFVIGDDIVTKAPKFPEEKKETVTKGESSKNSKVVKSSLLDSANVVAKVEVKNVITMNVPDPDIYNFDNDRTEASFKENEVWAAYDDSDGMPRFYAMIHSVVSRKPFKLFVSWLNSESNEELGPINWIGSGFYKTSGNFYIGKGMLNDSLNSFSHKIEWTKGAKATVQIYPKKGEVWALYKNWSPDWDGSTPDDVVKKYDMVEVLEDLNEDRGVIVSPLVKVSGFRTIFRRHPKDVSTMIFPKNELFRFSHQVASHVLTGEEAVNAPKGFLELDPAAMPLELLRAFTEKEVREMENSFVKPKEEHEKIPKDDGAANNVAKGGIVKKEIRKGKEIRVYKRRVKKKKTT